MLYLFEDYGLDTDRRELKKADRPVAVQPQVFDLLAFLIAHRDRVVTKDQIIDAVWNGRVVSESTLTSRINAAAKRHRRQRRAAAAHPDGVPQRLSLHRRGARTGFDGGASYAP